MKKPESLPVVPTSQDQRSDEVKLYPEKDLELDSNTLSPITTKPAVTARNTRSSTTTVEGLKSNCSSLLKSKERQCLQ